MNQQVTCKIVEYSELLCKLLTVELETTAEIPIIIRSKTDNDTLHIELSVPGYNLEDKKYNDVQTQQQSLQQITCALQNIFFLQDVRSVVSTILAVSYKFGNMPVISLKNYKNTA